MAITTIILAAGQGSRMNSDRPKVLHPLAGAPLLVHAMKAAEALSPDRLIVVTGVGAEEVEKAARAWNPDALNVRQEEQLGTGHAVRQAETLAVEGTALVLYGDTPFIRPETLERMLASPADVTVLGFRPPDPVRYGRLIAEGDDLRAIVEWKDADAATRAITLCNSGVVACRADLLFSLLTEVTNDNAAGEYYLTDIVALARGRGLTAKVVECPWEETLGINTRAELAAAEAAFQTRARAALVEDGVTLVNPDQVILAHDTVIGREAEVQGPVVFGPGVTVESGAVIRPFSHLEGCHVSRGALVGPFARLRPGAELAEDVHIGNFVEVKAATIAEGAKINHLSYIGDATVGARTNIGAGTITCNYDGVFKHRTVIGAGAFIGSDTMLVAPVTVGDGAMTATGTVVTQDIPAGAMAIGRAPQANKPGFATRFMDMLRARKAAQKG